MGELEIPMSNLLRLLPLFVCVATLAAESFEGTIGGRRFFVPDIAKPVRGALINNAKDPAGGASNILYNNPDWRALAQEWNLAQFEWEGRFNKKEEGRPEMQRILDRLVEAAATLKKPEIAGAPVFLQGLSGCACDAAWLAAFTELHDRVAGVILSHEPDVHPPADIPGLYVCAGSDYMVGRGHPSLSLEGHIKHVTPRVKTGKPGTVVVSPGQTHHIPATDQRFAAIWMDEILRLRLPPGAPTAAVTLLPWKNQAAWLGRFTASKDKASPWNGGDRMTEIRIASPAVATATPDAWIWLPGERVAQVWKTYMETGTCPQPAYTIGKPAAVPAADKPAK